MPTRKKISQFKPLITNLAQTSHYQVIFGGLNGPLMSYLAERGVDTRFITESAGLLCSSASIPGSSLATADINGNYMGVQEKMAHTRIFTQMQLEFYVDSDYRMLKFLEHWMEFIASGSEKDSSLREYSYRMRFPDEYKSNATKIIKFDRDHRREVEYNFIGLFPINLSSLPVSYDSSNILKVSIAFNYERYIPGKITSQAKKSGSSNNVGDNSQTQPVPPKDDRFLGAPEARGLNSQQTLDELYEAGRSGRIKSASQFVGPFDERVIRR